MNVTYMNGAGNSFMVLDARGREQEDFSALAKQLCAMRHADGLIAVGNSDRADFKMIFYNADGSLGEMCGNGARCICRFGHDIGLAGDVMTVETDAGLVPGWRLDENLYRVKLNNPYVLDLHRKGDVAYVELGHPGGRCGAGFRSGQWKLDQIQLPASGRFHGPRRREGL